MDSERPSDGFSFAADKIGVNAGLTDQRFAHVLLNDFVVGDCKNLIGVLYRLQLNFSFGSMKST